ncbi:hypothetical protein CkaCkLH20_12071 [Colletotrichum karsti]|uniref:Peptidase S54 rhomboid domain-containing protein n=1 Tax=Colletotrichum karsti TaxID=1095194 RepID=A0A9P6LD10_9PEZI|nr:uncharacterized protein CkaCkLH20_12071 [Colletotrichum karsti]KAF9870404.1 hypothetical protein CkaCkLH20_12071 [Colletotrichum karsti]
MASNVTTFSTLRARSYIFRLPLFTRIVVVAIVAAWAASLQSTWDVKDWGALIPDQLSFTASYRMNTYPFVHVNFIHVFLNLVALTPLLERFEAEFGTLTSIALFIGPLSTIPAVVYVLIERFFLKGNVAVMGASIWVFLLLGMEAIRTYKTNPYLTIATHSIPTWTTPLILVLVVTALVPGTSLLGHLCGVLVGYLFGLGYLKFLSPPEKALRWVESKLNLLGRLPHYLAQAAAEQLSPCRDLSVTSALSLRRDPRILKLPPYISLACILGGIAWLFLLPLNDYSRKTYISENALLPGQVHTYFGGSDQNVLRAYKHEVNLVKDKSNYEINDKLEGILKSVGLKVGRQNYTYESAGDIYSGENIYAILQAPRGDATEAIVLVAAWNTIDNHFNQNGIPLAVSLIRYFKRWSLWSKDIILVIPPDSRTGTQAWVDAYHDSHDSSRVSSLPLKSGALQGAIAIDYPQEHRFESIHVIYDGINGQLPNLDLINSVVNIAGGQMGMGTAIQEMWSHSDKYQDRLRTMLRGMLNQGLGHASGPHSSFIPYHVDAVTLQPFGEGWHDEMGMGRTIEGTFRSLNNLLEHLHQSFFFYLLMHKERFVSIGTYLPSAMILAASFTITAISLWVKSGHQEQSLAARAGLGSGIAGSSLKGSGEDFVDEKMAQPPRTRAVERDLFVPLGVVAICQFLGVVPLYIFNHVPANMLSGAYTVLALTNCALPFLMSSLLTSIYNPTVQQYQLIKSFSLLLLGMFLSALATLNFSLAFLVGVMASPLSFMQPWPHHPLARWACAAFLQLASPTAALYSVSSYFNISIGEVLKEAAFGWDVWGMYTPVIIWGVWWPAWLMGSIIVLGHPASQATRV